ncbi:MAG: TRAP transporter substrate-binding protein [Candidatus Rokuibacteriota bacterium]|nr:MAG: TRAP transporter substrate-binding protein [Candidatus Rokubacteria bacterium]
MKRWSLAVVLLAVTALPLPAAAQTITLKLSHFVPAVAPPHVTFLAPWAAKVEKESGGRLKIQIFPSMQLGGTPPQLVDQIRDGVVDIGWTVTGYTAGRFPKTEVFEIPFLHTSALATTLALQEYQEKHLRDEYKDYHVLLLHVHGGALVHASKPMLKLEDYKGLKIRTPNRGGSVFLRGVGASPVGAPVPEVPQMLSKGVIDGALLPYEIANPLKIHELVKYHSEFAGPQPRIGTTVFLFGMNKKRYESLPPDLRKVIDDNSGRHIAAMAGQNWDEIEKPGKAAAAKAGNSFPVMPLAEVERVRTAVRPEIDKFLKELAGAGFDANALYAEAQALIGKHAK